MRALILSLVAQWISTSIAIIGIVSIAFAVTGRWPPPYVLLGSSIGGALSPIVWRLYRAARGRRRIVPSVPPGGTP
jgi:ABC-type uncharacterized transport system permease subunit